MEIVSIIQPLKKIREDFLRTLPQDQNLISEKERQKLSLLEHLLLFIGDKEVMDEFISDYSDPINAKDSRYSLSMLHGMPAETNKEAERSLSMLEPEDYELQEMATNKIAREMASFPPAEKISEALLKHYGISVNETLEAWRNSGKKELYHSRIVKNLDTIIQMERQKGGGTALLSSLNGIRCFGRYDLETLIEQTETLRQGESFGIIATAHQDHNDAFSSMPVREINKQARLAGIPRVCIIEFNRDNLSEILEHWQSVAPRSEETQEQEKAEYFWVNTHGESLEIQTRWEHVLGVGPNRTPLMIKQKGAVACFMCYGGQVGGPMETIAKEYSKITTTGPTKSPKSFPSLSFIRNEKGELEIHVTYNFNDANKDGRTATYHGGE